MSTVCCETIKANTVIRGEKGKLGSQERYDFSDETFCEFEFIKEISKKNKFKITLKITKTNVPSLMACKGI